MPIVFQRCGGNSRPFEFHLVHMICIDGHYDMASTQARTKYNRRSGFDFGPVDYVKYAEAFGATGLRMQNPDEIAPTRHKAFDTPGPVLVRSAC